MSRGFTQASLQGKCMTENMVQHVTVIAEAGVNHNGSLETAKRMAGAAHSVGADIVKFQTFDPTALVVETAPTAAYQKAGGFESQRAMLERLTLTTNELSELKSFCESLPIRFLSTAFDMGSFRVLEALGQTTWKIPSGEITNVPLVDAIGKVAREVILSTGMATLGEIEQALGWLEAVGCGRERVTVLHCNTEYPTPYGDVHLRAMNTIGAAFGVRVGYSDHTMGVEVPIAAVALGATVIEKHFTLDRSLPGPDQKASLEPGELREMVSSIRNIELALGRSEKRVTVSERKNVAIARKGIYAARPIAEGEILSSENITTKRPVHGIEAGFWKWVVGRSASRAYQPDEPIEW